MFDSLTKPILNLLRTTGRDSVSVVESPPPERGANSDSMIRRGDTVLRLQSPTRPLMNDCVVYIEPDIFGRLQEVLQEAAKHEKDAIEDSDDMGAFKLQLYPPQGVESRCIVCDEAIVGRLESVQDYPETAFAIIQNKYMTGCPSEDRPQPVETHVGMHYKCCESLVELIDNAADEHADELLGDAL